MTWTLETAKKHLDAWLSAELAVSTGQSYRIGTRQLQRADLAEIRRQIQFWRTEVAKLSTGRSGMRVMRIVPRDL
jgi:hypothetical protein